MEIKKVQNPSRTIGGNQGPSIQDQNPILAPATQITPPTPPKNQQGSDTAPKKGPNKMYDPLSAQREDRLPYWHCTEDPQPSSHDATK